MLADAARHAEGQAYKDHLEKQGEISRRFLERNANINQWFRLALLGASVVFTSYAFYYVASHADPMANVLLHTSGDGNELGFIDEPYWRAAGAVLLPVVVLLLFSGAMIMLSLHVQKRGVTEFERLMDGVSRIRRDAVGVTRTRSVTFIVEETLDKAKRAFAIQLWMGRTLFGSSLVFVLAFAVYSVARGEFDGVSIALAGGSLLSLLATAVTDTPDRVGNALGDVTQLQLIVMTTAERIGVTSEYAYTLLEAEDSTPVAGSMPEILQQLRAIAEDAARQIQQYAEPRGLPTPPAP